MAASRVCFPPSDFGEDMRLDPFAPGADGRPCWFALLIPWFITRIAVRTGPSAGGGGAGGAGVVAEMLQMLLLLLLSLLLSPVRTHRSAWRWLVQATLESVGDVTATAKYSGKRVDGKHFDQRLRGALNMVRRRQHRNKDKGGALSSIMGWQHRNKTRAGGLSCPETAAPCLPSWDGSTALSP